MYHMCVYLPIMKISTDIYLPIMNIDTDIDMVSKENSCPIYQNPIQIKLDTRE